MKSEIKIVLVFLLASTLNLRTSIASAFEGRITATLTRGGETETFLYAIGTNQLRIERSETNLPYPQNLVDLDTGDLTLLFPQNRSFVRLKPDANDASLQMSPFPGMPTPLGLPPSVGPQTSLPPSPGNNIGPTNLPGMPPMPAAPPRPNMPPMPASGGMPAMPMMPPPMMERMELKATGQTTNLLGYDCTRYELKQRGSVMEIWATDKLIPIQPYLQNQPHRFGPRMIEDQWAGLLKPKKLFPLLATLKYENGFERLRFEVKAITPEKIEDKDGSLFQPPPDYHEIQPLPF